MKKIVALLLTLCLCLSALPVLAEDWESFEDWQNVNWDEKTIAYQFFGEWELAEYGFAFKLLVTLYDDGSALVDQRNANSNSSYFQYGYWSEETTEDGNEIAFDTLFSTGAEEGTLVAHEYSYELYEEEDGNYSFGYTFGIAPGAYFREADMAGGKDVLYATMDEFHAAVDVPAAE